MVIGDSHKSGAWSVDEYAGHLQRTHIDSYETPITCMKLQLDRTSNEVSHYTGLASALYKDGTIGVSGATRVGYSRKDEYRWPTDIACLSKLSSLAPPGVTHVSISVAQSCQEDFRRLDRTQLKLPDSSNVSRSNTLTSCFRTRSMSLT